MAKQLNRRELYDLVWSTPMRALAAQFGISDVGLKKTCARAAIPTPDRGYWAKKEAGKQTFQVALPKRAPGMNDEVVVARGSDHWYSATEQELLDPLPSPPAFPEPLDEVRKRIAEVVGEVVVPRKVQIWHPTIDQLLKEDERRREQQRLADYPTSWNHPLFDSPLERRRLRILNSLFFAVAKMNGKPTFSRHEPRSMYVTFFQQHVGITLDQQVQPRRGRTAAKQLGSHDDAKLALSILHGLGSGEKRVTWQDDDGSKLETHMPTIAVEVILTAELRYRESAIHRYEWRVKRKAELEEKERQRQIEAERAEKARQRRIEQARIDRLLKDAAAFQQANEIRKYVEVLQCVSASKELSSSEEFNQWSEWALAQADRIDPAVSGKFAAAMQDEEDDRS